MPGDSRPGALPRGYTEGGCGSLGLGSSRAVGPRALPSGQPYCCTPDSGQHVGDAVYAVHEPECMSSTHHHELLASGNVISKYTYMQTGTVAAVRMLKGCRQCFDAIKTAVSFGAYPASASGMRCLSAAGSCMICPHLLTEICNFQTTSCVYRFLGCQRTAVP